MHDDARTAVARGIRAASRTDTVGAGSPTATRTATRTATALPAWPPRYPHRCGRPHRPHRHGRPHRSHRHGRLRRTGRIPPPSRTAPSISASALCDGDRAAVVY
ncbi:hypothetical protein GCM10009629_07290 [Pseudonocardia alni]